MAVETADDRAAMLADFGEVVTVDGANVTAIIDREYIESLDVQGYRPVLYVRTVDITGADEGDAVVAGGVNYTVAVIQNDGTGMSQIVLEAT